MKKCLLFNKCFLPPCFIHFERGRQTHRQTDRQTDRQREREGGREREPEGERERERGGGERERNFIIPFGKFYRINKQREVITLEQLTSRVEQAHNSSGPRRLATITPPGMRLIQGT